MRRRITWLGVVVIALITLNINSANAQVIVSVKPIPKKVRVIKTPKPFPNAVWITGEWTWNMRSNRYVWRAGRWVKAKRNKRYVAGKWERRRTGWIYIPGKWVSNRIVIKTQD